VFRAIGHAGICGPVTHVAIMMTCVPSSREVLYALAVPRSGWIIAVEANAAGVSRQQLARYAESGVLRRSHYGIYRFRDFPAQPFEDVIEACLWAGPEAAASHETALAIYALGDAMPASIHITVPHRLRKKRAGVIVHVAPCTIADVETRDGVPITSAVRTIRDIAAISTIPDTASIVREAEESGLLRRREAKELTKELMGSK
jgi:predicted transcriptional regulator of viral defense system